MSEFDRSLRLFQELDGLDDSFIEAGMLPDTQTLSVGRGKHRSSQSPLLRFLNSGWGVAILCAVVSLSVLTATVRWGLNGGTEDAPSAGHSPSQEGSSPMDTYPEETVPLPEASNRVPAGTVSVDENRLRYVSYGDGTCSCLGFERDSGQTALHIPDYSPDGDVVVSIDSYAFRNSLELTEVTLPAGLRRLDHKTFPMEAPIYRLYGNILYIGSDENPYLVAVATADNRPGATSIHPDTRVIACHALTYDAGSYFALKWKDSVPVYTDDEVFTLPSGLRGIGEYALLDVGRDIAYNGYLVGWDALTSAPHTGLVRTVDGEGITVTCRDGRLQTVPTEADTVYLDATAFCQNGILYGGYFTYRRRVHEDYYAWIRDPSAFAEGPDQFMTDSAPFGTDSRVLTLTELSSVTLSTEEVEEPALRAFAESFNRDPIALYDGKAVVMLYLRESALYTHTVSHVAVADGEICVTLTRGASMSGGGAGGRFILIPVDDPDGTLAGAVVRYEIVE